MGMGLAFLDYLVEKRLLRRGSKILDIGSQNPYNAMSEAVASLIERIGQRVDDHELAKGAERLSYFSTPRPGERMAFVAELLDLAAVSYLGYDICPAPRTEIFDLNVQRLPIDRRNSFDIILNFGTTEHLINQLNFFEMMHDATMMDGVIFHQIPSVGWVDHDYFNYNAIFIDDLVKANHYEVLDCFYTTAGQTEFAARGLDIRDPNTPLTKHSARGPDHLPNFNLNYLVRKKIDAPLYVGLEIATTHAALSDEAVAVYGEQRRLAAGDVIRAAASTQEKPSALTGPVMRGGFPGLAALSSACSALIRTTLNTSCFDSDFPNIPGSPSPY